MGSASTLVHPGAAARRGWQSRATGVPHWWRGLLLATLLGGSGAWVRGCHCCAPDCENDTAPEGTRFQVEVLEELPESDRCHRMALAPGDRFFLTAGPTVDVSRAEGGTCPVTQGSGPPEGVEANFEYIHCSGAGDLGADCDVTYPSICPDNASPGHAMFQLIGTGVLDSTTSDADFRVTTIVSDECAPSASCDDKYRIRISRVMEE